VLAALISRSKRAYLPSFAGCRPGEMRWRPFVPGAPVRRLRYGVLEPVAPRASLAPRYLDLVIVPLVAFDSDGNRLGMGAGYYDRCFSFLNTSTRKPELMGVGYEFQRVEHIEPKPWDVPVSKVITECGIHVRGRKTIR
jgi:5-formyltetrahydrofolate cyclo-ligase